MSKIPFTAHDRQPWEHTFKPPADRRLRDRCHAISMTARGRRHHQIAADLRVTPRTLQRWLHAYRTGGLDGRTIHWAAGRAPRSPERWLPEMGAWVKQGPAGCGRDRANWTAAELATALSQTKGIAVSERTMRTFCPKHGVHPYRPPSQSLTGDPDQQEAARQDRATLKNRRSRCTRFVESKCRTLFQESDAPDPLGRQRAASCGGPSGLSCCARRLWRPQPGDGPVDHLPC
jgi:transposase